MEKLQTAVLVSGGGTNLQALIDNEKSDANCPYHIALVVSSSSKAYALERAKTAGIPAFVASATSILGAEKVKSASRDEKRFAISAKVLDYCHEYHIEAIVLAGFLTVLGGNIIEEYSNKIINLHPALLPKFGGVGMYGHNVHEAVLAAGEKESGCTIHLVDAGCDTGKILLKKTVPVMPGDTPETLYARIAPHEHKAMVEGLVLLAHDLKHC
ncbi:MAG: phosphoribosylglycinamide formyltransferase [Spirochaetaceae bacterium]|nr:phosphoribosylglycinamide formyltransferase [Spirochaetaceae bacterium]